MVRAAVPWCGVLRGAVLLWQGEGDLKGRYLAASCGSVSGCSKRDWSSLLLGLRHANERLQNDGVPRVNLKIAVRITAILVEQPGGLQMGASPIPDCTVQVRALLCPAAPSAVPPPPGRGGARSRPLTPAAMSARVLSVR